MKLKLAATSDVHIGVYGTAIDPDTGLNAAFVSNRRCRQFMIDYCRENQPDYVLFVGDLYKTAIGKPSQEEQWEATNFFEQLSQIAPTILKPGNHDQGERGKGEEDAVHALKIFSKMNLRLKLLPAEGWSVVQLEGVKVGLYHGMLSNVRLESGLLSDTVRSDLPKLKDAPPADLYVLGDIHHRQFIGENAAYCGALDRLNFGEEDENPSFWWIEIDDLPGGKLDIKWKAIKTPARKFITIVDEDDLDAVDVKGAVVRFSGELKKHTQHELIQRLKRDGALEVPSVSDTSELDEAPTVFSSTDPEEAYAVWVDSQVSESKDIREYSQVLLKGLLGK